MWFVETMGGGGSSHFCSLPTLRVPHLELWTCVHKAILQVGLEFELILNFFLVFILRNHKVQNPPKANVA